MATRITARSGIFVTPRFRLWFRAALVALIFVQTAELALAQGNYEVQVYGSEMVPLGRTMVELHSNFTFEGSKNAVDGVRADQHALHETIEITQGFAPWFETGFYIFMSYREGEGYQWVTNHIRPRVRIPEKWHWPVNVSISTEIGYQRRSYSTDTWTLGDSAHRRQTTGALVYGRQPRPGALLPWVGSE